MICSEPVGGRAKAIAALLGAMRPMAIDTLTRLAVPPYVNGNC